MLKYVIHTKELLIFIIIISIIINENTFIISLSIDISIDW